MGFRDFQRHGWAPEQNPEYQRARSDRILLGGLTAASILVASLALTAENWPEVEKYKDWDEPTWMAIPPGCEMDAFQFKKLVVDKPKEDSQGGLLERERANITDNNAINVVNASIEKSQARKFNPGEFNLLESVLQLRRALRYELETIPIADTGITIQVYSDAPEGFTVNDDAVQELFLAPLLNTDTYRDPHIRAIMECLSERIIQDKELAGVTISLYISGNPEFRFYNGRLQIVPQDKAADSSRGFALPHLHASALGMDIIDIYPMGIAPGEADPEKASEAATGLLAHELIHELIVLFDTNTHYDPEETFVKNVEKHLKAQVYPQGYPIAIRYDDDHHA